MKNLNKFFLISLISLTATSHVVGMGFLSRGWSCVKNIGSSIKDNSVLLGKSFEADKGKVASVSVRTGLLGLAGYGVYLTYRNRLSNFYERNKKRLLDLNKAIGFGTLLFSAGVAFSPVVKSVIKDYMLPGLKNILVG